MIVNYQKPIEFRNESGCKVDLGGNEMKKKFDDSKSSIGLWFAWASMAVATFIFIYLIIINFTVSTQIIG